MHLYVFICIYLFTCSFLQCFLIILYLSVGSLFNVPAHWVALARTAGADYIYISIFSTVSLFILYLSSGPLPIRIYVYILPYYYPPVLRVLFQRLGFWGGSRADCAHRCLCLYLYVSIYPTSIYVCMCFMIILFLSLAYVGNTRSEEKNTILYSDLAYKWNILEPINGISWEITYYILCEPSPGICIFVFPT